MATHIISHTIILIISYQLYQINHIISFTSHYVKSSHTIPSPSPHTIPAPIIPSPIIPYHIIPSPFFSFRFVCVISHMSHHLISSNLISFHPILSYHIYISYMSPHLIKSYLLCFCSIDYSIQFNLYVSTKPHNYFIDTRYSPRKHTHKHSTYNRT